MKITKLMSMLAVVLMTALIFSSCDVDDADPVGPGDDVPNPPKNISAVSIDHETVRLSWEVSSDEGDALFEDYTLSVSPGVMADISIPAGNTMYTVKGLTEGVIYTFTLTAEFSNGKSSDAIDVKWSPAGRYKESLGGQSIKLYGSSSSVGSGLQLYDFTEEGPMTRTVNSAAKWNFAFDDRNGYYFGTAGEGVIVYNWQAAPAYPGQIGTNVAFNSASLDNAYDKYPMNDGVDYEYNKIDINSSQFANYDGIILYVRAMQPGSNDYNYARVLIKKGSTGFIQSDALGTFIQIEISYQSEPGVPHAGIE